MVGNGKKGKKVIFSEVTPRHLLGNYLLVNHFPVFRFDCGRLRVSAGGGIRMSAELEARIFELEMNLANAELERDAAYTTLEINEQTRERHALQVIADIAGSASNGQMIPTLETLRILFGQWAERQKWNNSQFIAIMSAMDALDDIIAGRIQVGRKTAAEVIGELEK